jgi:hypothetical protein
MISEQGKTLLEETGKFLIDIAKLVFGGIILTNIMKTDWEDSVLIYTVSSIAVAALFVVGLLFESLSKRENKEEKKE